jgi:hypothetical protein
MPRGRKPKTDVAATSTQPASAGTKWSESTKARASARKFLRQARAIELKALDAVIAEDRVAISSLEQARDLIAVIQGQGNPVLSSRAAASTNGDLESKVVEYLRSAGPTAGRVIAADTAISEGMLANILNSNATLFSRDMSGRWSLRREKE